MLTCSALLTLSMLREACSDSDDLDVNILVAVTEGRRQGTKHRHLQLPRGTA